MMSCSAHFYSDADGKFSLDFAICGPSVVLRLGQDVTLFFSPDKLDELVALLHPTIADPIDDAIAAKQEPQ